MATIKDYSYGVIPVMKIKGVWQVLLIHQISRRGDTFWTFPKGHPEEGESFTETALRELAEETGVSEVELDLEHSFTYDYSFRSEDNIIEKSVHYYLGYVSNTSVSYQKSEVVEANWYSLDRASKQLTHDSNKKILVTVGKVLVTK